MVLIIIINVSYTYHYPFYYLYYHRRTIMKQNYTSLTHTQHDKQSMYKVTLRHVHETIVAMEK